LYLEEVVLHRRFVDGGGCCEKAQAEDTDQTDLRACRELQFPHEWNGKNSEEQICGDVDGCAGQRLKEKLNKMHKNILQLLKTPTFLKMSTL
jgi:hypothetical protein